MSTPDARLARMAVNYVCPIDRAALVPAVAQSLLCSVCARLFEVTDGVVDLDTVKAVEREAFDQRFRGHQTLSQAEIAASAELARRFLAVIGRHIDQERVLDMACGNGALTHGILTSPDVSNADVFCFDHSIESMRVFLHAAASVETTNRLHPSIQDVHRPAYSDGFFDIILGNAVLHHFLEYEEVLRHVHRCLKKGGVAVFAEPVAYGYIWAAFLMKIALEQVREQLNAPPRSRWDRFRSMLTRHGTKSPAIELEGLGLLEFITSNTFFRLEHYADKAGLASLTDKHYFLDDEMENLAAGLGFSVRFSPFEPPEYYREFMWDMLRTYGVVNAEVAVKAQSLYSNLRDSIPRSIHRIVPHFKFIILQK